MGRLTTEKEQRIYEVYQEELGYAKTARKTDVDPKTVKRIITEKRHSKQNPTINLVEQLSPDQSKILYAELDKGINPVGIVKKHGFPMESVEKAYNTYRRLRGGTELRVLSRKILEYTAADKVPELQEFDHIMNENGFLTVEQIMDLLEASGTARLTREDKQRNQGLLLPDEWHRVICQHCGQLILATSADATGAIILSQCKNMSHIGCGGKLSPL